MFTLNGLPILADEIDVLTELRDQLAINNVHRFAQFKQTSNHIQFPCPMHKEGQERKPSCGITTNRIQYADGRVVQPGSVHCFACGYTDSLEGMISKVFGHDDDGQFGKEWLAKNFVTVEIEERKPIKLNLERKKSVNTFNQQNEPTEVITEELLDSYRYTHPYMYKRKLTDEVIEIFDIGYDPKFTIKGKDGSVHNYRCITFPNKNMDGSIAFIARRSVDTKFFHYPRSVVKPVYGLYEIKQIYGDDIPKEVYICESMLDALAIWTHPDKIAVALNGLGTPHQFEQLLSMPFRKFILATDSDEPGMKARAKIAKALKSRLITQVFMPEGKKDINDCTYEEVDNLKEEFFRFN